VVKIVNFQQAAKQQAPEAQYQLGIMVREGLGTEPNDAKARAWFELAASQGFVPAYFPTGDLYFHAPPDPHTNKLHANDLAKAYLWLSATTKRSENATDLEKSRMWLSKFNALMPENWKPSLDAKVDEHLDKYATLEEPLGLMKSIE